jgi:hypothetical protein
MAANPSNKLGDGSLEIIEINVWFHGVVNADVPRH